MWLLPDFGRTLGSRIATLGLLDCGDIASTVPIQRRGCGVERYVEVSPLFHWTSCVYLTRVPSVVGMLGFEKAKKEFWQILFYARYSGESHYGTLW